MVGGDVFRKETSKVRVVEQNRKSVMQSLGVCVRIWHQPQALFKVILCISRYLCVILAAGIGVCSLAGSASRGMHVKMTAINLASQWLCSPRPMHTHDCQFIK